MTYSIVAYDPETGQIGAAVQTHVVSVGRAVLWMAAGRGAIATQSLANFRFGPMTLTMFEQGIEPDKILDALVASDKGADSRQIGLINASGTAAAWTGAGCIREASHHVGENYSVQANMMTNPTVVPAMVSAFENATGDLAQRMMAAMEAAQAEGGDIRGMQSAALKVVPRDIGAPTWDTVYDVRVDEHTQPLAELARILRYQRAQRINGEGYAALDQGDKEQALQLWQQARTEAPEHTELAYWQAMTLADEHADIENAVAILKPMLDAEVNREHWVDLITRLSECGILAREGTATELLAALDA